jgi:hypothetical protein
MKNPFKPQHRKGEQNFWKIVRERVKALLVVVWAWIVNTYNRLSGELRRRAVIAKMLEADIILASPRTLQLSLVALIYRLVLRAQYVHSMLYLGGGKVIHTTGRSGVVVAPLPRSIYKKSRYTILRVRRLHPDQRERVIADALRFKDKKLDRAGLVTNVPAKLFGLRTPLLRREKNRLWCSKLIHQAYVANGIDLVPQSQTETVTSEDLSNSPLLERV